MPWFVEGMCSFIFRWGWFFWDMFSCACRMLEYPFQVFITRGLSDQSVGVLLSFHTLVAWFPVSPVFNVVWCWSMLVWANSLTWHLYQKRLINFLCLCWLENDFLPNVDDFLFWNWVFISLRLYSSPYYFLLKTGIFGCKKRWVRLSPCFFSIPTRSWNPLLPWGFLRFFTVRNVVTSPYGTHCFEAMWGTRPNMELFCPPRHGPPHWSLGKMDVLGNKNKGIYREKWMFLFWWFDV